MLENCSVKSTGGEMLPGDTFGALSGFFNINVDIITLDLKLGCNCMPISINGCIS